MKVNYTLISVFVLTCFIYFRFQEKTIEKVVELKYLDVTQVFIVQSLGDPIFEEKFLNYLKADSSINFGKFILRQINQEDSIKVLYYNYKTNIANLDNSHCLLRIVCQRNDKGEYLSVGYNTMLHQNPQNQKTNRRFE